MQITVAEFNSILILQAEQKEVGNEDASDEDIMAPFGVSKAIEKHSSYPLEYWTTEPDSFIAFDLSSDNVSDDGKLGNFVLITVRL